MSIELKLTLSKPIGGFWDGGRKSVFTWSIYKHSDSGGKVQVGSWEANQWVRVGSKGTDKQILSRAKTKIYTGLKRNLPKDITYTFEYVETDNG